MIRKRILCTVLLLSLQALPLLADSGTWTNGSADGRWDTAANWSGVAPPANGETATFDGSDGNSVPTAGTGEPGAGSTVHFTFASGFTSAVALGADFYTAGGAVGTVTIEDASANITLGLDVTGDVYVYPGGAVTCGANRAIAGAVTLIGSGGADEAKLEVSAGTTTVAGVIDLQVNGYLSVASGAILDANGGITISELGAYIGNDGTIAGIINAGDYTVSYSSAGTIVVDVAGTLDLGTTVANEQTVDIAAGAGTVTIGNDFLCDGLDASSGSIAGGGKTITVGSGGLDWGAATLDAAGTLNVEVAAGETTIVLKTSDAVASRLGTLTVSGTATASGVLYASKFAGAGILHLNGQNLLVRTTSNDFWTFSGTLDGTGAVAFPYYEESSIENNTAITIGGTIDVTVCPGGNGVTVTQKAALSVGGILYVRTLSGTAGHVGMLIMSGAPLTVTGNTLLGLTDRAGGLTLAGGQANTFGGTIARNGEATANTLTLAGRVAFGGNVTLAGMTADFGTARIDTGAVAITGTTATAISNAGAIVTGRSGAVTFTDLDTNWTAGNPAIFARRWTDGGGNGVRVKSLAPHWMTGLR